MRFCFRRRDFDKGKKQKDNRCFAFDNRFRGLKVEKGEEREMLRE